MSTTNIVLIGNTMSGKTTFFRRIKNPDKESQNYICTIGVEMHKTLDQNNNNIRIYDTPGRHLFKPTIVSYLQGSDVFILFFLVDNMKSFDDLKDWVALINKYNSSPKFVLIGNINTKTKRTISNSDANHYANNINAKYHELSIQTDYLNNIILDNICIKQPPPPPPPHKNKKGCSCLIQ